MTRFKTPKYRRQRGGGANGADRAFVQLGNERRYLGLFGTPESRQEYDRLIAEWLANGRSLAPDPTDGKPTVAVVLNQYWQWVKASYQNAGTVEDIRYAIRPLRLLYADTLAEEFGPKKLKIIREWLITGDPNTQRAPLSRKTANRRIRLIRAVFAWAAEQELVAASVWHSLLVVKGLRRGQTAARETEPVAST